MQLLSLLLHLGDDLQLHAAAAAAALSAAPHRVLKNKQRTLDMENAPRDVLNLDILFGAYEHRLRFLLTSSEHCMSGQIQWMSSSLWSSALRLFRVDRSSSSSGESD